MQQLLAIRVKMAEILSKKSAIDLYAPAAVIQRNAARSIKISRLIIFYIAHGNENL